MLKLIPAFLIAALAAPLVAGGADAAPRVPGALVLSDDAGAGDVVLVQNNKKKRKARGGNKNRRKAGNKNRRKAAGRKATRTKKTTRTRTTTRKTTTRRTTATRKSTARRRPAERRRVDRTVRRKSVRVDRTTRVVRTGSRRNVTVRERRVVTRTGRARIVRSRRVVVVDRRWRNRYYRGRSIYYRPPVGAAIVASAFVVSAAVVSAAIIHETLAAPPVVAVPRRYTVNEIVENPEIRQKVRSIDLDSIEFASGQAEIPPNQYVKLDHIAGGMQRVLKDKPNRLFLIEGHTDAVGDADANLALSEDRAASVKLALIEEYGISADNLEAVGYGEQYLKVDTGGPSRENRRVTVRNISDLVVPDRDPEIAEGDAGPAADAGAGADAGAEADAGAVADAGVDDGGQDLTARERDLIEREKDLLARERDLVERERALDESGDVSDLRATDTGTN